MAQLNFDATQINPESEFEPIPAGTYIAKAVESEWKETSAGTGQYLQFRFDVIEGEYKGRCLFVRFNLKNPNPTAVKIASQEMSQFCHAANYLTPKDSSELHNIPVGLVVTCKDREDKPGTISNEIKKFVPKDEVLTPQSSPAQPPSTPQANSDETPGWMQ